MSSRFFHTAALSIAKRNAFRAYEVAGKRKRDTVRITVGLALLFVGTTLWEGMVFGNVLGPHWLILVFVGLGFRAIRYSDTQLELARANLAAVSELHDALSGQMGDLLERVDEKLTALEIPAKK